MYGSTWRRRAAGLPASRSTVCAIISSGCVKGIPARRGSSTATSSPPPLGVDYLSLVRLVVDYLSLVVDYLSGSSTATSSPPPLVVDYLRLGLEYLRLILEYLRLVVEYLDSRADVGKLVLRTHQHAACRSCVSICTFVPVKQVN